MSNSDDYTYYEQVAREMIRHEDALINNRMGWLTTISGFLFTAVGFIWEKQHSFWIVTVICGIGVAFSVTSWISLTGATQAMARIRKWWEGYKPADYKGPGIIGLIAPWEPNYNKWADRFGPWDAIALMFLAAWLLVLGYAIYKHISP